MALTSCTLVEDCDVLNVSSISVKVNVNNILVLYLKEKKSSVQNEAARFLIVTKQYDKITPTLSTLHSL